MNGRPIFDLKITFVVDFKDLFFCSQRRLKDFCFRLDFLQRRHLLDTKLCRWVGAPNYIFSNQFIVTMLTFAAKIVSVCMRVLVCARACVCLNETEIQEK